MTACAQGSGFVGSQIPKAPDLVLPTRMTPTVINPININHPIPGSGTTASVDSTEVAPTAVANALPSILSIAAVGCTLSQNRYLSASWHT